MVKFKETTNISLIKHPKLSPGYPSAVQKANVGSKYTYMLQLRNNQHDTWVVRGLSYSATEDILHLVGDAAGHTQTWEFAGVNNNWFVGVKTSSPTRGKKEWAKQIARVNIKTPGLATNAIDEYKKFPRLAYLNRAGKVHYTGTDFWRAEAAVSPDHQKFLLVTMDVTGNAYFTIYSLATINKALDKVASLKDGNNYVNMENVPYLESFRYPNLDSIINSFQGFDLDNSGNIYISSQLKPDYNPGDKTWTTHHKQIVKIPKAYRTKPEQWTSVNLSDWGKLDIKGEHSEVEGIQVIGENHVYLTVAYHKYVVDKSDPSKSGVKTVENVLYELSWK